MCVYIRKSSMNVFFSRFDSPRLYHDDRSRVAGRSLAKFEGAIAARGSFQQSGVANLHKWLYKWIYMDKHGYKWMVGRFT